MEREVVFAVALGANLGDRAATLAAAVRELRAAAGVSVEAVSGWLETPAVGGPPGQPDYLNGALVGRTTLSPRGLHELLQAIEQRHGRDREREGRNGPRTLDLDLLVHGDARLDEADLVVPHPRLLERDFVLVPLASIAPALRLPVTGRSIAEEAHRLALRRIGDLALEPAAPARAPRPGRAGRGEWGERREPASLPG